MPTLASMWTWMPPTANDSSSAARSRRPAVLAVASSPGWRMTANSSPPSRASVSSSRSSSFSRGPIWRSTSSPAWWPSVSLSSLKPSRSINSSASSLPFAPLDSIAACSVSTRWRRLPRPVRSSVIACSCESRRRSITVRPARPMPTSTVAMASAMATGSMSVNWPTPSSVSAIEA